MVSARTTLWRPRSTLKPFCSMLLRRPSLTVRRGRNASGTGGCPMRLSSAARTRHGLAGDAPERDGRGADVAVLDVKSGRHRDEGERVAVPVADLQIPASARRMATAATRYRGSIRRVQCVVALGVIAGQREELLDGRLSAPPSGPCTWTVASRIARATAMSDGWIATQSSLAPKMACSRLKPVLCRAPRPRDALVALREGRFHEVRTAGALQQVAPCGGHVPQLSGGTAQDRLRQHRILGRG